MGIKDEKRPPRPARGQKLDALRQALESREKPSDKFMRAFQTLMRKGEDGGKSDCSERRAVITGNK